MKTCFGYIRVSTQKQGEGVSLEAQKDAITAFASRNDLTITKWFEEKETAAKSGRPVFTNMLKQLKQGKAEGVIIHKIDRSARNLHDWATFSSLPDQGIGVYVATESLDFNSRGGRLTADIQAVIAADYIRNLREECIKGIHGRLKQGLYPFKAPLGYLDTGKGKPKTICPKNGPLVKLAFELYASGQFSYLPLLEEMDGRGLKNFRGGKITLNGLSKMLQNPFYVGLIRIKTTGATYQGVHQPLIDMATWKQAQDVRTGRSGPKVTRHNHLFQGLFTCAHCGDPMVPELQKQRVYYRCKRKGCPTKTIREDALEAAISLELKQLQLSPAAKAKSEATPTEFYSTLEEQRTALTLQLADEERRLERLQDLLLDEKIDIAMFDSKKEELQLRIVGLRENLEKLPNPDELCMRQEQLAELQKNLVLLYEMANRAEKRIIVENIWPNRTVSGKKPLFKPDTWLLKANRDQAFTCGAPERDRGRTFIDLIDKLRTRPSDAADA